MPNLFSLIYTNMKIRQRIVEVYLNRVATAPEITNPDWDLDDCDLRQMSIRWPSKYEWAAASDWVEVLLYSFRRHLDVKLVDDISQDYKGTVVFQIVINKVVRTVAIGYSDYLPIDENCERNCDLYFKMQFDLNGYASKKIVPGGYVADGKRLYFHLSKLRRLRNDCNFTFDVNGRFGLGSAREVREKAVNILSTQNKFTFQGGMKMVSYLQFLKEVAHSKICIDMPGLGPFCFRLMNYMAIGSCVIAYPHRAILHSPLIDRKHIVYCKEDFSDLEELCEFYLENDDEREAIAMNAREFFDLNLHKDNLVKYYLRTIHDRLA